MQQAESENTRTTSRRGVIKASQTDADTEAAKAATVSELWHRRTLIIGQACQPENDDNFKFEDDQDEVEWAMVRTPSTRLFEVAYKLEVVKYWGSIGDHVNNLDLLLLESAICDLSFAALADCERLAKGA